MSKQVPGDVDAVRLLLPRAKDRDYMICKAVELLASLGDPPSVTPYLIALAHDENYAVRATAVRALGQVGGQQAIDALVRLLPNDNLLVREAVFSALKGRSEAVEALTAVARHDESTKVRCLAIELLGYIRSQDIATFLVSLTHDPDDEIRAAAAGALGQQGDPRKKAALLLLLIDDWSWRVRGAAARALGEIGAQDAADALADCLLNKNEVVAARTAAAESLGKLGVANQHIIEALMVAVCDSDWTLAIAAINAINKLAETGIADLVAATFTHENPCVRTAALQYIARLCTTPEEAERLMSKVALALEDEDYHVRAAAVSTLTIFDRLISQRGKTNGC